VDRHANDDRKGPVVLGAIGAMTSVLILATSPALASNHRYFLGHEEEQDEEIPYDEAKIFFELNDTDGDLGIHALIDGDAWRKLNIEDPYERSMMTVWVQGRLRRQGVTEIFFESAEPTFDELKPEAFFRRFPAGIYEVEGRTLDGEELESEALLTHVLPAPPGDVTINSQPARPEDGSDCEEDELPELSLPVVIEWNAVTDSHPDLGEAGDVEVIRYRAVAEAENEEEQVFVSEVDVQPDEEIDRYSVTFSDEFFVDESEVKFEILVREETFNQTAVESCPFEVVLE
jgi:hypothetical protein